MMVRSLICGSGIVTCGATMVGGVAWAGIVTPSNEAPTNAQRSVLARASERTNMAYLPGLIDFVCSGSAAQSAADRGWRVSNQPRFASSNARKYQPGTGHCRDEN